MNNNIKDFKLFINESQYYNKSMKVSDIVALKLKEAKDMDKAVKAARVVVDAFKADYSFTSGRDVRKLFSSKLLDWGLNITLSDVEQYETIHKIYYKKVPRYTKELKTALKFIEQFDDQSNPVLSIFYDAIEEFNK